VVNASPGRREWQPTPAERYRQFPIVELEEDYEERLRFDADRHRLVLALGGLPFEIRTSSEGIYEYMNEVFGPFVESGEPVCRLEVGETDGPLPLATQLGALATFQRGTRIIGRFREMAGFVDTATHTGRGLIAGQNYRQDLANFLRLAVNVVTPPLGAVLFHTAAVARNGRTYIFYGAASAGKSTLSELASRRYEIMTDDMLVLRLADGELRAATCGFWGGETKCYPTRRIELPIQAFFRLRKAERNRVSRLPDAIGVLDLICGVPSVARSAEQHQPTLEFASKAASQVAFHELEFHKNDDSFWSTIDAFE